MDFRIYIACVTGIAMLRMRMAGAGCKEDLEDDRAFQECRTGYITYLVSVSEGGNNQDGSQLITLLCSPEGQAAMECLKEHIESCEDLAKDPLYAIFGILKNIGGCPNAPQQGSMVCVAAVQNCSSMAESFEGDESAMEGAASEFNKFQEQIKTICGGVKAQFDCIQHYEEQCPELENTFRNMMEMGRKQSMPGQPFPDFDTQKAFVMEECPKLPKDFSTNKCVKDKLMTSEYTSCYADATKDHAPAEGSETMSCDGYKAAFPCVTSALETCGKKYQDGFRATTNFFLASTQEDCQLAADDTTGSASIQKMSSATILTLLFLVFK